MRSVKPGAAGQSEDADRLDIQVIRSKRRRKTISATLTDYHTLQVRVPATIKDAELSRILEEVERKARATRRRGRTFRSDADLVERANRLNDRVFDGKIEWSSIRWVSNQRKRFGSCTPARGTIRISDRLKRTPSFVLDYVIVHELAHLIEHRHNRAFWCLVNRYKLTERARGYLMALGVDDAD